MPLNQVQVNPPSAISYADGATPAQLAGKQAEGIVSELHGQFYTQTARGNVYYASNAAAGGVYSIYSNTSFVGLMLLNPIGSGKNLSIIRACLGLNTQASTAMSTWGYVWNLNWSDSIGTPWSAKTALTATRGSCICGLAGQGSSVVLAYSAATFSAAGAFVWTGRNAAFTPTNAAITVGMATNAYEDFDGTFIVPPGTLVALSSIILTGWTAVGTFIWEEVPI